MSDVDGMFLSMLITCLLWYAVASVMVWWHRRKGEVEDAE